jgi:hypothetical protein
MPLPTLVQSLNTKVRLRLHRASLEILDGLHALVSSAKVNARRYAGLLCIGVLAPLSMSFYKLFDSTVINESWYYVNHYYLFHTLGTHSFMFFFWAIGIFFLTPNSYSEYWTAPFIGYPIIKAALIVNVTSNEEWHASMDSSLYVAVVLTGLCFTLGLNFFTWMWAHKTRGLECRMDGLFQSNISAEQKTPLLEKTWNEYKNLKKVY